MKFIPFFKKKNKEMPAQPKALPPLKEKAAVVKPQPQKEKKVQVAEKKVLKVKPEQRGDRNKKRIFIGLVFVVMTYGCVVGIFYFLVDTQQKKITEIGELKEQVELLKTEKMVADRRVKEVEGKLGATIRLDKLIDEAKLVHGQEELNRKEGSLWIDRVAKTYYVTLGALNGLYPGSKVTIYDGDAKLAEMKVATPLDVISYVEPIDKKLSDFSKDYYRAVFEEQITLQDFEK